MQQGKLSNFFPSTGAGQCRASPSAGAGMSAKPCHIDVLAQYWGYSQFRFCQQQVIETLLSGGDALVVMPTGGGKSICYQIPPLVLDRVCIVVSPLISLMEDQVAALNARRIPAAFLGSAQSSRQVKDDAWAGKYLFVYMTPELATASGAGLAALHSRRGIALVAIDEAHCVSEWGHDFRPDYRRLGVLRDSLPDVSLVALTATATPRVRDDIVRNLRMRPGARRFVESFERTNLHFAVRQKVSVADAMAELVTARRSKGEVPSTLIYALTTREVDEIAAYLNQPNVLNGRAGRYHAKLSATERRESHAAFMRDDLDVLVASVAYGMGIDKPNVRVILHWGVPASVEAYYQQAGRAGRDGANSRCVLYWSPADITTLSFIKEGEGLSAEGKANLRDAMAKMQAYCNSTGCRHAHLVNFFTEGALPPQGPCRGGCDMCDRRRNGEITARDVAVEARLLLSAVAALHNKYGLNRSVQLLRGSRSKELAPWMVEAAHAVTGDKLHGAGSGRSDSWWKGLGGLLAAEGLLQYHSVGDFQVVRVSDKGARWLRSGEPLVRELPPALQDEETRAYREAMAKQRLQEERQQAASAEAEELEALRKALREERKRVADSLGHNAPDTLVNDLTLDSLARLRPREAAHLRLVDGMGQAAVETFGEPLMKVIRAFMATAQHLGRGTETDWICVARLRGSSNRLAASSGAAGGGAGDGGGGGGGAAGGAVGLSESGRAAARRLLGEPKGAATEAGNQWQGGMSVTDIATKRARPIAVSTALGYVAECVAAGIAGDAARLALEAGLERDKALAVAAVVESEAANGIGAVKRLLDSAGQPTEYGQIKVVAALMASGSLWFGGPPRAPPAATPARGPHSQQAAADYAQPGPAPSPPFSAPMGTPAHGPMGQRPPPWPFSQQTQTPVERAGEAASEWINPRANRGTAAAAAAGAAGAGAAVTPSYGGGGGVGAVGGGGPSQQGGPSPPFHRGASPEPYQQHTIQNPTGSAAGYGGSTGGGTRGASPHPHPHPHPHPQDWQSQPQQYHYPQHSPSHSPPPGPGGGHPHPHQSPAPQGPSGRPPLPPHAAHGHGTHGAHGFASHQGPADRGGPGQPGHPGHPSPGQALQGGCSGGHAGAPQPQPQPHECVVLDDSPVGPEGISAASTPGPAGCTTLPPPCGAALPGAAAAAAAAPAGAPPATAPGPPPPWSAGMAAANRRATAAAAAVCEYSGVGSGLGAAALSQESFSFGTAELESPSGTPDLLARDAVVASSTACTAGSTGPGGAALHQSGARPPLAAPRAPGQQQITQLLKQSPSPPGGRLPQQQQQQPQRPAAAGTQGAGYRPPVIAAGKRTLPAFFGASTAKRQATSSAPPAGSAGSAGAAAPAAAAAPMAAGGGSQCAAADGGAAAATPSAITRDVVLSVLRDEGPMTAVALAARLCGGGGGGGGGPRDGSGAVAAAGRLLQLHGVLQDLVGDFEVMRQGAGSMQSEIDMDDGATTFQIL